MNSNEKGLSSGFHVCATCNYWMGSRKTDTTRTRAIVLLDSKGDCHQGSPLKKGKPNSARCDKWEKWGGIK